MSGAAAAGAGRVALPAPPAKPLRADLRWLRRVGPARLVTTAAALILALLVGRYSWDAPILVSGERYLYDLRTGLTAPRVDQDPRFLLVAFTEGTLQRAARRSPLDRKLLGGALTSLDRLGAKAIGVDVLIDQAVPGEDGAFLAALRQLRTPTYFATAANSDTSMYIMPWQETNLRRFFREAGPRVRPASIRLIADPDGVIRRWPPPTASGREMAMLLAGSAAQPRGAVRFRQPRILDRPVFNTVGVELLAEPAAAALVAPLVRGRIVLVGADLPNEDRLPTPLYYAKDGQTTAGMEIHAHMAAQALDGAWERPLAGWTLWLCVLAAIGAGALLAMQERRSWWLRGALLLSVAALVAGPVWLASNTAIDTYGFPALGWGLAWLTAFIAVGSAARSVSADERRFAQGALGRYLPKDVAQLILREPERLALKGEDREIFALFTDLEGFTKLSHRLTPHQVGQFMNAYLDQLCEVVLRHGGTIDKFVGDAVVAFWGAPVARPDDARQALAAAHEMAAPLTLKIATDAGPVVGRTRVGLHHGPVVVGNFGGSGRIQYTALGDAMNTAARLEAANKAMKTRALVSREAKERMETSTIGLRPMGRIVLRGRETPIEVYEPVEDLGEAAMLDRLYERFEAGDRSAVDEMRAIAAMRPDDLALDFFVFRLRQMGPGGTFRMD